MYESKSQSDVVLVVSGREFRAHKSVLVARSPEFASLFEPTVSEKRKTWNRIEITEAVSVEAFEDLLKYIYTGKFPPAQHSAQLLLISQKVKG